MESRQDLYLLAGETLAASQTFEVAFVLAAKFAIRQADISSFEDIKPVSQSKDFKQPVKAILNELRKAQSIPEELEGRVRKMIDDRHRFVHRAFLELGWPANMSEEKEHEFIMLCRGILSESKVLTEEFNSLLMAWFKKFPPLLETALKDEPELIELVEKQGFNR